MVKTGRQEWKMKPSDKELVYNHGDFSTNNVIVDPVTLKVKAILDWEYAGFYPEQFERKFFKRVGPSIALVGEEDDIMIKNELI
jgi:aminoglycoside phosphotransferase